MQWYFWFIIPTIWLLFIVRDYLPFISVWESKRIYVRIHVDYFLPSFPQMTDAIIYTDTRGDKIRDCRSFLISLNFSVTWLLIPEFFATRKAFFEQRRSLRPCANVSIDQRICLLVAHRWKWVYRVEEGSEGRGMSHHHILSYDLEKRRRYVYLVESKIGCFRRISLQLRLIAEHFPLCESRSAKLESNF